MQRDGWGQELRQRAKLLISKKNMFEKFVYNRIKDWGRLEEPVTHFVADEAGNCIVNDILKFENMNNKLVEYVNEMCIKGKIDSIPHKNSSDRQSYEKYFDQNTHQLVQSVYKKDLRKFGYRF
ncbi:hypothetical protein GGP72_003053 [Salinibacter ruber]|uniref:Uncharacterized protein n=2 Tax=Salinibacter ruber TaxID=146919 RepID=A0A9X2Q6P9_9BACT|nr:hypothetical protein [Salinibacter ruber]MCS3682392.1 hypothetical protein [Salinibacter ruber]